MTSAPSAAPSPTALIDRASQALAAAAVTAFVLTCWLAAVNVPVGDDYAVLESTIRLREVSGAGQFLVELFTPHNEHRIVLTRLVAWATSFLPSGVDFRIVSMVGVCALLGALALACRLLGVGWKHKPWAMAVLLLTVLQPQLQKLMFYPMASVQAFGGILFGIAYLGCSTRWHRPVLAIACFVLALMATSAAIVLPFLCAGILLLSRRYRAAAMHALLGLACSSLYLQGVARPHVELSWAVHHPSAVATMLLSIMGSAAELPSYRLHDLSTYTSLFTGGLVMACVIRLTLQEALPARRVPAPSGGAAVIALWYCLAMAALLVAKRAYVYQDDLMTAAQDARYRVYGLIAAAICAAILIVRLRLRQGRPPRRLWGILIASAFFNLAWYSYSQTQIRNTGPMRTEGLRQWARSGDPASLATWAVPPDQAASALQRAQAAGLYTMPGQP